MSSEESGEGPGPSTSSGKRRRRPIINVAGPSSGAPLTTPVKKRKTLSVGEEEIIINRRIHANINVCGHSPQTALPTPTTANEARMDYTGLTTRGKGSCLPSLPHVPGDEGVGEVVEIGKQVCTVKPGNRVVLTSRLLGTWRYYGIYHERDVHIISPNIPLPEASMLTAAPCIAYRMIKDYRRIYPGETILQNAANSPCGQCVIQLCKAWGINTFNIVSNRNGYRAMKQYLLNLGATAVYTLEEAEELTSFNTSLSRPVLAFNCLGGRYEDVILKLLERCGVIVYHGFAYDLPLAKQLLRRDAKFYKFRLSDWDLLSTNVQRSVMINQIIQLMVVGKLKAPLYEPVLLRNYVHALKNTVHCEAFSNVNYVFDFTIP
ncbi:unnamed protein product [Parnassius apollo]|uniref:(apollo) hypothetical protein n=1 Tax=Parnassius apollo TaxID=110799 RepID=A0A8S3WF75_PARAO|nr:unnamed protein product [Parnassius apollo]